MDTLNAGEIIGLACKASVYKQRKRDIDALIKMWFDSADYVLGDLDHHSAATLAYLKTNASTEYSLNEFKRALSFGYYPRTPNEVASEIVALTGKYSIERQAANVNHYLMAIGAAKYPGGVPKIISLDR